MIFNNPHKFGTQFNNLGELKKEHLCSEFVKNSYGNSFIDKMSGDPIEKVYKMKQKRKNKLKKYLFHGSNKSNYDHNKVKLQNGAAVSIDLTPDYHFKRMIAPHMSTYHEEIQNQINRNSRRRENDKQLTKQKDAKDSH